MFLIGIIGIIMLLGMFTGWMWRVAIPWLILLALIAVVLSFVTEHIGVVLLSILFVVICIIWRRHNGEKW